MLNITPLYAGTVALLFLVLSFRVVLGRYGHKISIGDGGDEDMVKRMRVQANCAEYAPLALILLAMAEIQGMQGWLVHVFGLMLLAGRMMHAYGLGSTPQIVSFRQWGMYLTIAVIVLTAVLNIVFAIF